MSDSSFSKVRLPRITRPRTWAFRVGVGVLGSCAMFLLWSIAYLIVATVRYNPARFPSEGATRWTLLEMQSQTHGWPALFLGWNHFYIRLFFVATREEAIIRALIALGISLAVALAAIIFVYVNRKPTHHGDAAFGSIMDAEACNLSSEHGLVVGRLNGVLLSSDEPSHILVVGPTRSGKGVSFIIPNGYMWRGSSVWFDPKRENFDKLAAYRRAKGDQVFMFWPGERNSHRYNPLDYIRLDERLSTDCSTFALFVVPELDGDGELWAKAARQLLAGLIGYVVTAKKFAGRRNLRSVIDLISTGEPLLAVLQFVVQQPGVPADVIRNFNQFIAIEKKTRNSALFNLNESMKPWNNDLVAAATEKSDFDIRDLRRKQMAIFIGCSVAELRVFGPLIRIFVQQIHDCLMKNEPGPDEPHEVLMMLDEFRQLGRMDSIVDKMSLNATYGFRLVVVVQDLAQLDVVYGRAVRNTIISDCQVKLFIRINDVETSKYVSEALGNTTVEIQTPTIRANRGLFSGRDKSVHYISRPVKSPQEVRKMTLKQSILFTRAGTPFALDKVIYYKQKPFKQCFKDSMDARVQIPLLKFPEKNSSGRQGVDNANPSQIVPQSVSSTITEVSAMHPQPTQALINDAKAGNHAEVECEADEEQIMTVSTLTAMVHADAPSPDDASSARTPEEVLDDVKLGGMVQNQMAGIDDTSLSFEAPLRKVDTAAATKILARFRGISSNFGDV